MNIIQNLNLEISKYMFIRFKELGVPVVLTRETDVELSSTDSGQRQSYEETNEKN